MHYLDSAAERSAIPPDSLRDLPWPEIPMGIEPPSHAVQQGQGGSPLPTIFRGRTKVAIVAVSETVEAQRPRPPPCSGQGEDFGGFVIMTGLASWWRARRLLGLAEANPGGNPLGSRFARLQNPNSAHDRSAESRASTANRGSTVNTAETPC